MPKRFLFTVTALTLLAGCSKSDGTVNPADRSTANADAGPIGGGDLPVDDAGPSDDPWASPAVRPNGPPVETQPANAPSQQPAFPGQTRAPGHTTNVAFDVRVVARTLDTPWGIALLPDGAKLVTERPGRMRLVAADGALSGPLGGVPAVAATGQGGLLDVVVDPAFAQSSLVYFTFSEPGGGGQRTAVGRGRLVRTGTPSLADVQVIWRQATTSSNGAHFGARIAFAKDGNLFVTIGERGIASGTGHARDPATSNGKVIRIRPDGTIPSDNPFVGQGGKLAEIWSLGHRNPQSAAVHPKTGALWTVEHGARGGDEVNVVRAGKDYGWPNVSYGVEYSGQPIGAGITSLDGVEQPVYYWDPVIAPAGAAFYDGAAFPAWRGSLFVGSMGQTHLVRLTLDGEKVIGEERLLVDRNARIRDVRMGATGTLFVSDESNGQILEIVPK